MHKIERAKRRSMRPLGLKRKEERSQHRIHQVSLAAAIPYSPFPLFIPALASEVEFNPLRQRQRVGVVNRIRLPPHVGPPCIRTRFAAAAGFLLATEGAAALGAGGADVDVGAASVTTRDGRELPPRLQVVGKG